MFHSVMKMKLTADNVMKVMKDCSYEKGDSENDAIVVDGIVSRFFFDKGKLKMHENDIIDMLLCLPDAFKQSKGGGWSFIMACDDKDGDQWGDHAQMEALFCLGISIDKVSMTPRGLWGIYPGGMPYMTVKI